MTVLTANSSVQEMESSHYHSAEEESNTLPTPTETEVQAKCEVLTSQLVQELSE
jgi:hypothetical protein